MNIQSFFNRLLKDFWKKKRNFAVKLDVELNEWRMKQAEESILGILLIAVATLLWHALFSINKWKLIFAIR